MIFHFLKSNTLAEQTRWILWTPVLFGAGIGFYFSLDTEPPTWLLLTIFELCLLVFYLARKNTTAVFLLSALMIFLFGLLWIKAYTLFQSKKVDFPPAQETTYLKGTILQTDTNPKGKKRLWLDNVSDFNDPKKGIYRITVSDKKQSFEAGQCVEMAATVSAPSQALIPNGFQFNRQAFYQGISAIGYNESNVFIIDCEKEPSFFKRFQNSLFRVRQSISSYIAKTLPQNEAAIASAVLVGQKNQIPDTLYTQYRNAGLAHFLSISGLHMGLISAFAFFFIRFLMALFPYLSLRYSSKKCAAVGAIFLSFIYLLFSGFAVPAERAFLMTTLVLIGVLLDRNAISMRMVAFGAFIILMFQPYTLLTPGFQMSFASVTALIAFYETWSAKFHFRANNYFSKFLFYLAGISLTTFIASIATLPFCLYHFETLAPYAIFGNILAAPIITFLVMPFIFLSFLLFPFHLSFYSLKVAGFGIAILNKITDFVSNIEFAGLHVPAPTLWSILIVLFGGLWLALWLGRWRYFGLIALIVGFGCFYFSPSPKILYNATAQSVGFKTDSETLIIFTSDKNNFLNQIWQQKTPKLIVKKDLQSLPEKQIYCANERCRYQNFFSFDLKGNISFQNKILNPQKDLGGAIYLKGRKPYLQTVRQTVGSRPWNQ